MYVIGLSAGNSEQEAIDLLRLAEGHAERFVNVIGAPFLDDYRGLLRHLSERSVALMLSVHEGFGLAGWEAIAAEVPLIVSRNSGLYQLLYETFAGLGTGCVRAVDIRGSSGEEPYRDEDIETVSEALTMSELALLLEGSEFVGKLALSPAPFVFGGRATAA
ncbi:MAG: hypothetical protein PHS79_03970 [Patescibacteria group bacterium]|nr:hypothetical protein [Patescibacteria group bacterium]